LKSTFSDSELKVPVLAIDEFCAESTSHAADQRQFGFRMFEIEDDFPFESLLGVDRLFGNCSAWARLGNRRRLQWSRKPRLILKYLSKFSLQIRKDTLLIHDSVPAQITGRCLISNDFHCRQNHSISDWDCSNRNMVPSIMRTPIG
jgi:hypothetical protein